MTRLGIIDVSSVTLIGTVSEAFAIGGAWGSKRIFTSQDRGALAWGALIALAAFGACSLTMLMVLARALTFAGGISFAFAAALMVGLAAGGSAPARGLLGSWGGSLAGVIGFNVLMGRDPDSHVSEALLHGIYAGIPWGMVALAGAVIGWRWIGREYLTVVLPRHPS